MYLYLNQLLFYNNIFSFDITYWSKPGPIQKDALKTLISDKEALFCLLTDKIDGEVINNAKNLQVIGTYAICSTGSRVELSPCV